MPEYCKAIHRIKLHFLKHKLATVIGRGHNKLATVIGSVYNKLATLIGSVYNKLATVIGSVYNKLANVFDPLRFTLTASSEQCLLVCTGVRILYRRDIFHSRKMQNPSIHSTPNSQILNGECFDCN